MRPLDGIKVLEVCRTAPGAFCTMMLADMGADVLKIESKSAGEATGTGYSPGRGETRRLATNVVNRNKRSMTLNLKNPEGQKILHALAADADALVEGFRPGVMGRLGCDYETLAKINPRLVFCSLTGYGQNGPYRDFAGHDPNYVALAGVLNLVGKAGGPPVAPLNLVADYAGAGLHGVIGILFALMARERTGEGQLVDISYLDSSFSLLAGTFLMRDYLVEGKVFTRGAGVFSGDFPWHTEYETADHKMINIACIEPWLWENLCNLVQRPDLKRLAAKPGDLNGVPTEEHRAAAAELREIFRSKTRDEWFDLLTKANVCVGKVYELPEVFDDPQLQAREMVTEVVHPEAGKVPRVGVAVKLSKTPGSVRSFAPFLGQHTEEVLRKLGYSERQVAHLREDEVI